MNEREEKVKDAFMQLIEGAITFLEFANYTYSLVTETDLVSELPSKEFDLEAYRNS